MKTISHWLSLIGVILFFYLVLIFLLGLGGCASSPTRSYSSVRVGDSYDQFVRWSQSSPF